MSQQPEIKIIDVIATTSPYGKHTQYHVVVDRSPKFTYRRGDEEVWHSYRKQRRLLAHDSGFYSFMVERPGTKDAFAGRKFTINLDDGGTLECDGHVWDEFDPSAPEPTTQVGVATIEQLEKCYCFFGGQISIAKLQAWLDENTASRRYYKYDPKHTVEWLDQRAADNTEAWGEKPVCAARARKLKKRGYTIRWRNGVRTWYPWYERRKAQILTDIAKDAVSP